MCLTQEVDQVSFSSQIVQGPELHHYGRAIVKKEPQFFRASLEFAEKHGGPITKEFLDNIRPPKGFKHSQALFDSRVHMLMPGMYPCIPGWHHDSVERDTSNGQPNYKNPAWRATHAMAIVGEEVSQTQFALGNCLLEVSQGIIYQNWHPAINKLLQEKELTLFTVPMERIIYFDDRALHQGVPATKNGWRWFGRMTWGDPNPAADEIRTQTQVYMTEPFVGW